jgi:virulence-associated protein VapD
VLFRSGFKNDQIAIYLRKKGYQTDVLRFTTNQTVNIDILYASKEDIKAILFYMNNVEV